MENGIATPSAAFANEVPINYTYTLEQLTPEERQSRLRPIAGRLAAVALLTAGTLVGNTVVGGGNDEAEAATPTCYGDYCSGLYADAAHCDTDADTLTKQKIVLNESGVQIGPVSIGGGDTEVGELEVRYSKLCGTTWALINTDQDTPIQFVTINQDTGYQQSRNVAGRSYPAHAVRAFTPMIYGRDHTYRASIYSHSPLGLPEEKGTFWVDFPK